MKFKKLFRIEYRSKNFQLLIDENNRRTFLEINKKGEYIYPLMEDYIALNEIYNKENTGIYASIQEFIYKEKVRIASGLMSVMVMIGAGVPVNAHNFDTEVKDNTLVVHSVNYEDVEFVNIYDVSELDSIYGKEKVTKEMCIEAIRNNPNLNEELKIVNLNLLNSVVSRYPNIDLRIYYENIKSIKVNFFSDEEYNAIFSGIKGSGAHYNSVLNEVNFKKSSLNHTFYHEFFHAFHHFYRKIGNKIVMRTESSYSLLDEAMTNYGVNFITESMGNGSYLTGSRLVDFLMTVVDFDYEIYSQKGTNELVKKCINKYPHIDFNYIFNAFETMKTTDLSSEETVIKEDCVEAYDELFKVCLMEAGIKKNYEPFKYFAACLKDCQNSELVFDYLKKYNSKLISIGINPTINVDDALGKFRIYKGLKEIAYGENFASPVVFENDRKFLVNQDGSRGEFNEFSSRYAATGKGLLSSLISSYMFMDYNNFGSNEFWQNFLIANSLVREYKVRPLVVNNKGKSVSVYLPKSFIQLGLSKDGKFTFGLIVREGEEEKKLIQVGETLKIVETIVSEDYLNLYAFKNSIDVSQIFNEDYLKELVKNYPNILSNLVLNSDQLEVLCPYKVRLLDAGKTIINLNNSEYTFVSKGGYIGCSRIHSFYKSDLVLDKPIYMREILLEKGVIDENNPEVEMSYTELELLCKDYFDSISLSSKKIV